MLKSKKSFWLATCVLFVAVLIAGFLLQRTINRPTSFPMQSYNISDLQPNEIIRQIADFAGVSEEEIFIPANPIINVALWGDFTFNNTTISLMWERRRNVYANQFRISSSDDGFFLTSPQRQGILPPFSHNVEDILYAIKYLPHEYIRSMFNNPLDRYSIIYQIYFTTHGWSVEHDFPRILYNRNGVIQDINGDYLYLFILPSYRCEDNPNLWKGDGSIVTLLFELG